MQPAFWKLSMGPGTAGEDFKTVLEVLDWIRRGVVLVDKNTRAKGTKQTTQGENFIELEREGDYFYLCHGNREPAVILLGQFTGPPNLLCERGYGWTERPLGWIRTLKSPKSYLGQDKWWAPSHNSTFIRVPDSELMLFEAEILTPYFDLDFKRFQIS